VSNESRFAWSLRTQWIPAALAILGLLLLVWYAPRCVPVRAPRGGDAPPWAKEAYTFDATNMALGEARARSNGRPLLLDFYLPG
jgi:hypothetical protein